MYICFSIYFSLYLLLCIIIKIYHLFTHKTKKNKDNKIQDGALGKPLKHKAADYQVDGTAQYTDDIPTVHGELYAGKGL